MISNAKILYAENKFDPKVYDNIKLSSIIQNIRISEIVKDGPAYSTNVKIGDEIVSIDGKKVKSFDDLISFINSSKLETIDLVVLRDDQKIKIKITPKLEEKTESEFGKTVYKKKIGIYVSDKCVRNKNLDWEQDELYQLCHHEYLLKKHYYLKKIKKFSLHHEYYLFDRIEFNLLLGNTHLKKLLYNKTKAIEYYLNAHKLAIENEEFIKEVFSPKLRHHLYKSSAGDEHVIINTNKSNIAYAIASVYLDLFQDNPLSIYGGPEVRETRLLIYTGEIDYKKGVEYLTISSKDNNSKALKDLGIIYLEGFGVNENRKKAFQLLKKSSLLGNGTANAHLADFYLLGLGGQKKNYSKAIVYFKLADISSSNDFDPKTYESSSVENNFDVSMLYKYKRLPKDSKEYYNWLSENINNFKSILSVQRLGYFAKVFLKDYSEAYKWYYICSSKIESNNWNQYLDEYLDQNINQQCKIKLNVLEKEFLSKTEIKEAKIAADKWTNKYMN